MVSRSSAQAVPLPLQPGELPVAAARVISVRGAAEHNLKHINLDIPRDRLVVFTGVSGSGKSSLAFDTIYAEGQRRYVESLSAYARQFLGQMEKPKVDFIGGLSPAISIEQKTTSKNPRSTVGTITEIYDYYRVLWARIGRQHCHLCGRPASAQTIEQMVDAVLALPEGIRFMVLAPVVRERKGEYREIFEEARREGYVRARVNGEVRELEQDILLDKRMKHTVEIVIDRLVNRGDVRSRLFDSMEKALAKGNGVLVIHDATNGTDHFFSSENACVYCGVSFPELNPNSFSFNSPVGRCSACDGLGRTLEMDPDLVVPNPNLSVEDGALLPYRTLFHRDDLGWWSQGQLDKLVAFAREHEIDLSVPWKNLPKAKQNLLLYGARRPRPGVAERSKRHFCGVLCEMEWWWRNTTSEGYRNYMLENYIRQVPCGACDGARLRPESLAVRVANRSIADVCRLPVDQSVAFFEHLDLPARDERIAEQLLKEIRARLGFLQSVGLYYLSLDRAAPTLSGGEAQRIRLASQIGSGLMGVLYILDEPSIGLHQRDNDKLISSLLGLRDLGNTVIVVEHDENTMRRADWIVDFGPGAGKHGGEVVAQGPPEAIMAHPDSLTGMYLSGKCSIPTPTRRRRPTAGHVTICGARENNLRHIDVPFPLGCLVCVTGVSGSGKSTLVNEILHKALMRLIYHSHAIPGAHDRIDGLENLDKVINISQDPIGRTPRSNPATYTKLFDPIRQLFAQLPEAKVRGYQPGRFSFNVRGGRCEACQGGGVKLIEMHFLPDVYVTCDVCKGRRFNHETLQVRYRGHDIAQVLDLSVGEARDLFANIPKILRILETLHEVGLDYVALGQPATTLSGGEAQRVKLARELCKTETGRTMYILDEPTTGLHFADVQKLLSVLQKLVDRGNTVVVIEHNLDVIKSADWIIDLGPEGGDAGGMVVATGTPEDLARHPTSYTGQFLKKVL